MDKVCIFGVDGFTGRHLQEYIEHNELTKRFEFIGCSRTAVEAPFSIRVMNATDRSAVVSTIREIQPAIIINLIGTPQPNLLDEAMTLNASISQWICEAVLEEKLQIQKIVAIGSAAEYGHAESLPIRETDIPRPLSTYGLAKLHQTNALLYYQRAHHLPTAIARTFNIIGSDMPPYLSFGSFIDQIRQAPPGSTIFTGNTTSRRDYLDIRDVIDAYWRIATEAPAGEVYNVCAGRSYGIGELLDHLIASANKDLRVAVDPTRVRTDDQLDVFGDNTKLLSATGWTPRHDILQTLAEAVRPT